MKEPTIDFEKVLALKLGVLLIDDLDQQTLELPVKFTVVLKWKAAPGEHFLLLRCGTQDSDLLCVHVKALQTAG